MKESHFLARQFEWAISGPAWHGPSLGELLNDVTCEEACRRPFPGMHTIAELVAHTGAWAALVERRIRGEIVVPSEAEDWPEVDASSEAAWAAAVAFVVAQHASLARATGALADEMLHTCLVGRDDDVATQLHGVIEHDAYHGGQIALLKKVIRASRE